MGKSTVTTKLEEDWRRSLPSWRVIVRLNLNLIQHLLKHEKNNEEDLSLTTFFQRFVPYIPFEKLSRFPAGQVKVIVLLDGLDEVCPQHTETMFHILHSLLLSPKKAAGSKFLSFILKRPELAEACQLEKVFLTTRPHLQNLIEEEFGVIAHSLLPLNLKEQIQFLSQEVSEVFDFPHDKAEKTLKSLPSSLKSLNENPLMLFRLAQVIKTDTEVSSILDLYDLYTRFVEAKHWLHVVEKDVADPTKPRTVQRVKHMLQENLPYYYAVALSQLQQYHVDDWPKFGKLPEEENLKQLLSYGLLLLNSSGDVEFTHRSFAEFFYARLLTASQTPVALRDTLFVQLYSESSLQNVEEFALCALRKRQAEFPDDRLLPISTGWLRRIREGRVPVFVPIEGKRPTINDRRAVIERFLEGRLFPLLGDEILSFSLDLEDSQVIQAFIARMSASSGNMNSRVNLQLGRWLTRRDPYWTRHHLFQIPSPSSLTKSWKKANADLAVVLLCTDPEGLSISLTEAEILSALNFTENLVELVCVHSSGEGEGRKAVQIRMGRDALKKSMMRQESLETSLKIKDAAWWMAEILSKDMLMHFGDCEIVRRIPWGIEAVWGEEVVREILELRLNKGLIVFEREGWEFAVDKLWEKLVDRKERVAILRKAVLMNKAYKLMEKLENQFELKSNEASNRQEDNLIKQIVEQEDEEDGFFWDSMDIVRKFELLPYVIRYGSLNKAKKLFSLILLTSVYFDHVPQILNTALILSLLVDETNNTYDYVLSFGLKQKQCTARSNMSVLFKVGMNELRKAVCSTFPQSKIKLPLVSHISSGEILIRLLPNASLNIDEETIKSAVEDFLQKSSTIEVTEVLEIILKYKPSYRNILLTQVGAEVSRKRNGMRSSEHRIRHHNLLLFLLKVDGTNLSWVPENSSPSPLMEVIVEIRLSTHKDKSHEFTAFLSALEDKLRIRFKSEWKSVKRLLYEFPFYRTEAEWSIVLQTLQMIPQGMSNARDSEDEETEVHVYRDPATPLLRVWLRYFGLEETRKVTEEETLRLYNGYANFGVWRSSSDPLIGFEAVLLAVELGSLELLERIGRPSLLRWKDKAGRTFLDISLEKWGKSHQVTKFLQQKFLFPFSSISNDLKHVVESNPHQ